MSRSRRKTPIRGVTTAGSEAEDKAIWHRRYRRIEALRLKAAGQGFEPHSHRQHSNAWAMDKDGKQYFRADKHPQLMRK